MQLIVLRYLKTNIYLSVVHLLLSKNNYICSYMQKSPIHPIKSKHKVKQTLNVQLIQMTQLNFAIFRAQTHRNPQRISFCTETDACCGHPTGLLS